MYYKINNSEYNLKKILKNFSFLFSWSCLSHFANLVVIILAARYFEPEQFGEFSIAQSIFLLIYSLSFHNAHIYLHKKLATEFEKRKKDIPTVFFIRFYTSLLLFLILGFLLIFVNISAEFKVVILLMNLIILIEPFSIFYSIFFIKQQFLKIWQIRISQICIFSFLKIYSIIFYKNIIFLCLIYVFEHLFFAIITIILFVKSGYKIDKFIVDKTYVLNVFKKIIIFPFLSFFLIVSMRVDTLMVGAYINTETSGLYSVSSRLISTLLLIVSLFYAIIFPSLSVAFKKNDKLFIKILKDLIGISVIISLITTLLIFIFGKFYLSIFGDNFLQINNCLKILSLNIFLCLIINVWQYQNYVKGNYLIIAGFQALVTILNIIFNYYFIYFFGVEGAALATLLSAFISFLVIILFFPEDIKVIIQSLSFFNVKNSAINIFNEIFIKKNPEKKDKIKL